MEYVTIAAIAICIALVLNIIVFFMYGSDKRKAEKKEWRTPESTLIIGGLVAPWGAIAGMQIYRHKTQKIKFKLIYIFAAIHIVIAVALAVYLLN